MSVLVLGGAGYIGSHVAYALSQEGCEVVVVDNLSTGHEAAARFGKFYAGDVRDAAFLDGVFRAEKIDAVFNFSAMSLVGESVTAPLQYYNNNVGGAISLLETMATHGVKKMIFSSTAAVYGEPTQIPILEDAATVPTNPYGETKLAIEKMLSWCEKAHGIQFVSLRYFNVAGANGEQGIGEDHKNETHLIPIVLQVALGRRANMQIFGTDYNTPDGTCIRDYIDVRDLSAAHVLALKYLNMGGESNVFNLGNGKGFSVREIIAAAREVTGKEIPVVEAKRRAGDPDILVASGEKAAAILGWKPHYTAVEDIISSAWQWHVNQPDGF